MTAKPLRIRRGHLASQAIDRNCILEILPADSALDCLGTSSAPDKRCAMGLLQLVVTAVLVEGRSKSQVAHDYALSRRSSVPGRSARTAPSHRRHLRARPRRDQGRKTKVPPIHQWGEPKIIPCFILLPDSVSVLAER